MTTSADQLRCPLTRKTGPCLYPEPNGIPPAVRARRWRRSILRLLGRPLREEELKYLRGSEAFHWFRRASILNLPICVDEPVDEDGQEIRGGPILEAWLYVAWARQRPKAPPAPRTPQQARAAARFAKGVSRGRIRAPAFAERVAPPRTVRADGVRTDESPQIGHRAARPRGKTPE